MFIVFKTNPLVSKLFTFAANLSQTVFLITSLFTTSLSSLNSSGTVFDLSISILSTSAFNLTKFNFNARLDVSISVAFLKFAFVVNQINQL